MTDGLIFFAYCVIGFIFGAIAARAGADEITSDGDPLDSMGLVICGLVGVLAGLVWPVAILGYWMLRAAGLIKAREPKP